MESSTAEGEALKRNTDCIYFLASPFTCKKGNECEFRHSEVARVNPRDCWYWMNGNCLNPRCAFRHPPLDGLFGIPGAPSGPSPSIFQVGVLASSAYNPNKQSVPCYYFQKGQCLKGDKCPFMHVPQQTNNNSAEQASTGAHLSKNDDTQQLTNGPYPSGENVLNKGGKLSTSFTGTSQIVSWGLQECSNAQRTIPKLSADTTADGLPINNMPPNRSTSPYPLEYEPPRSKPTITPVRSDNTSSRLHHPQPQPADEHYSNGREADDFLGESSPGFDVLVDGEKDYGRDSDYYLNEDDYRRSSVHGGRNLDQYANDFDYHNPDYEPVVDFERNQFNEKSDYDQYGREQDHYRSSSERATGRISKRRPMHQELSPEENNGLDLRHRLLKQRRLNGLRSIASLDHHGEPRVGDDCYVEDRYHDRSFCRDRQHTPLGSSLSSRLQGRITLPSNESVELQSERDRERRRTRGRLSPSGSINYKGRRPQDRINRRPNDVFSAEGRRIFGVRPNRRDDGEDSLNFAGPKSLAELKGAKVSQTSQDLPIKSIITPLAHQSPEDPFSFDGPKLLSDILKSKPERGEESHGKNAEILVDSVTHEAYKEVEGEDGYISTEGKGLPFVGQSSLGDGRPADATEDQELEIFGSRYGVSDYEATEGEKFNLGDVDNAYQEDENACLDDEDDEENFAKKVVGFFS